MNKKILLIGGGGFIGHHLAQELSIENEVFVIDNFMVNNLIHHMFEDKYRDFIVDRVKILDLCSKKIYRDDARDYHKISLDAEDCKPDIVIHLAAIAHANVSNKDPYLTFDHSLKTLENSLDIARAMKIEKFIYFSSSMVYGDFENDTAYEDDILKPKGIYGCLKYCGELMVKAYNQVFDMPYIIIRPSALYGERCVSRRVIQVFIENIMEGKEITIAGDGSEKIDFTYIDDLVQGIKLIVDSKVKNQTFNLTYGTGRSINDVVEVLHKHFLNIKVKYEQRDKLVPFRGSLSVNSLKQKLGYNPQYPIEKGIEEYVRWYSKR